MSWFGKSRRGEPRLDGGFDVALDNGEFGADTAADSAIEKWKEMVRGPRAPEAVGGRAGNGRMEEPFSWGGNVESRSGHPIADTAGAVIARPANDAAAGVRSAIGAGTTIEGRLTFDAPVRIDGCLRGEVKSTSGLTVGPMAEVNALMEVDSLVIFGRVIGSIRANRRVEIRDGGVLEGDVCSAGLVIEGGGVYNGRHSCRREDG